MEPPEDPAESWRQIQAFIKERPDDADWSGWKGMARGVIAELAQLGLTAFFRVGQAGHHVVFSMADLHVPGPVPRVTLEFHPGPQTVRIAYGRTDLASHAPLLDAWVSAPVAVQVTLGALRRLWTETRPVVPMPKELEERKSSAPD